MNTALHLRRAFPSLLLAFSLSAAVFCFCPAALAADADDAGVGESTQVADTSDWLPTRWWRGSGIGMRNVVSALTLDPAAEPHYNPYYVVAANATLQWWMHEKVYFRVAQGLSYEVTESDVNTYANETVLDDFRWTMGFPGFVKIPTAEIVFSGSLSATAPTSKASIARTLYTGLSANLSLSRKFSVLSGLSLSYSITGTKNLHRFTTSETETPRISGCDVASGGCDPFLNTGRRNSSWRMMNTAALGMAFIDELGIDVSGSLVHSFLYAQTYQDDRVTVEIENPVDTRYAVAYDIQLWARPMRSLRLALGMSTFSAQRAPDQSYRDPFFNRDTTLYLDLRFDIDGLIQQIQPENEEGSL